MNRYYLSRNRSRVPELKKNYTEKIFEKAVSLRLTKKGLEKMVREKTIIRGKTNETAT